MAVPSPDRSQALPALYATGGWCFNDPIPGLDLCGLLYHGAAATLDTVRRFSPILWVLLAGCVAARPQGAARPQETTPSPSLSAGEAQADLERALANELAASQDTDHPMRYRLCKITPRLSTTHEIYETRDGGVARLLKVDGRPLGAAAEQQERARLQELADDPGRQRHREQAEAADRARALKVLRALPAAFLYQYVGRGQGPAGPVERFTFRRNPAYSPPDMETQVLAAMGGEIWIDPAALRVVRLQGSVQRGVQFGWGILGRLDRGGWVRLDQAKVEGGAWRTIRLQLEMSGRVLFRTRRFDLVETMSGFVPLPVGMSYREAIGRLLAEPEQR
jgi:hypothetical protein